MSMGLAKYAYNRGVFYYCVPHGQVGLVREIIELRYSGLYIDLYTIRVMHKFLLGRTCGTRHAEPRTRSRLEQKRLSRCVQDEVCPLSETRSVRPLLPSTSSATAVAIRTHVAMVQDSTSHIFCWSTWGEGEKVNVNS